MTIESLGSAPSPRVVDRNAFGADAGVQATGRAPASPVDSATAVKGAGAAAAPTLEQVSQAVSQLNQSSQAKSQGLEFSIDNDSKRTIVKVVDQTTKEVLRQIPSPEALEIAKSLGSSSGLLIKQTA